jgi:CheY-like chemotaxis protein
MNTKILVVDDNKSVCEIYKTMLTGQGYDTKSSETGQEALDLLSKEGFDLILLDIMMPEMDGLHILDIIKANTDYEDVKVIMLTALGDEHIKKAAEKYGASDYIVKSEHDMKDVLEIISKVLSK